MWSTDWLTDYVLTNVKIIFSFDTINMKLHYLYKYIKAGDTWFAKTKIIKYTLEVLDGNIT